MEAPFVSVIVLNYNGAHFLPTCLGALRQQTYPADRFEVIVTDNGSTDDSLPLLKRDYPWVRLLENGRNLGFSLANNAAARIARGEFHDPAQQRHRSRAGVGGEDGCRSAI